jgi:type VI protein secretion system component Hcp
MRLRSLTLTAACLAACAVFAAAQKTHARAVGRLACTNASGTITAAVYGYSLDVQQSLNIGSQGNGAGAGKVTFSETEMDLDAGAYTALLQDVTSGEHFAQCELTTNGGGLTADFKLVLFDDVKLAGGTAETPQQLSRLDPVTVLNFSYGALQVTYHQTTGAAGALTGGWNRVTNTSTTGGGGL